MSYNNAKVKKQGGTSVLLKSEFWVTVVTAVSGLLMAFGVITQDQSDSIAKYVPNMIGALLSLISSLGFVKTQHAAKVEVFRALCAANMDKDGQFRAQGVGAAEDRVREAASSVGL